MKWLWLHPVRFRSESCCWLRLLQTREGRGSLETLDQLQICERERWRDGGRERGRVGKGRERVRGAEEGRKEEEGGIKE